MSSCLLYTSSDLEAASVLLKEHQESIGFGHLETNSHIAKVSVVGAGMINPVSYTHLGYALVHRGADVRGPLRHGSGGAGISGYFPDRMAGGNRCV